MTYKNRRPGVVNTRGVWERWWADSNRRMMDLQSIALDHLATPPRTAEQSVCLAGLGRLCGFFGGAGPPT